MEGGWGKKQLSATKESVSPSARTARNQAEKDRGRRAGMCGGARRTTSHGEESIREPRE